MYIQTKIFSEVLQEGYTYPSFIPPELQTVITSWYQFRNVCDDEKFGAMFDRVLNRDYDRYEELLRIDPTISDYDWLVQRYRERLLERVNNGSIVSGGEASTTSETEYGHTIGVTGRGSDVEETEYGHTIAEAITDDKSTTRTLNTTKKTDQDDSESESLRRTGTNVSETVSDSNGSEHGADYTDTNDNKTMGKDMPMSNSYAGASGVPGVLDWSNPSTQAEVTGEVHRSYDASNPGESTGHSESTTTETPDETNARTITRDNSTTEKDTGTVTDVVDGDKTSNVTNGGTDTKTITKGSGSDTTHGGTDTTTVTKQGEETKTTSQNGTDKEIYTGRDEDPAKILRRASAYISNSSAWEWLKSRLDVCFIQVYKPIL